MEHCDRCGTLLFSDRRHRPDGLEPLADVGRLVQGAPRGQRLCDRCREERRLTGAAVLGPGFGLGEG